MSRLTGDLRYGARLLIRTPGVAVTALLTLALAIGAVTAMFSVVDAVLIRPLPYPDAGRLAMVWEDASQIGFPRNTPAPANWRDWREQNTVFTDIAATRGSAFTLTGNSAPERIPRRFRSRRSATPTATRSRARPSWPRTRRTRCSAW